MQARTLLLRTEKTVKWTCLVQQILCNNKASPDKKKKTKDKVPLKNNTGNVVTIVRKKLFHKAYKRKLKAHKNRKCICEYNIGQSLLL